METETTLAPVPASALVAAVAGSWGYFDPSAIRVDGSPAYRTSAGDIEARAVALSNANRPERAWTLRGLLDAASGEGEDPDALRSAYAGDYRLGYAVGVERIAAGYDEPGRFDGLETIAGRLVAGDYPATPAYVAFGG